MHKSSDKTEDCKCLQSNLGYNVLVKKAER